MSEFELVLWFLENNPFYKFLFVGCFSLIILFALFDVILELPDDNKVKIKTRKVVLTILEVLDYERI